MLLALLALLAIAVGACGGAPAARPRGEPRAAPHVRRRRRARCRTPATAPLAGGGTAPSPLAVRLDQPGDRVQIDFKKPPRSALLFDLDTGRVL